VEICRGKFPYLASSRKPQNDQTKAGNPGLRCIWGSENSGLGDTGWVARRGSISNGGTGNAGPELKKAPQGAFSFVPGVRGRRP
jgi:hypothetical protein